MKIKNREQFLMVLVIAAAALYVGANFILAPLQGVWSARQKQIHELRDRVAEGRQLIRREAGIRGHWDFMRTNALPTSAPQAEQSFLKAVDAWAHDSGAEITSIMPQWKNDATNYMTLNCRLETTGDLNSLGKFIYDIEKGPMPLRLDTVELSAHDNTGQTMTLGLEINGLALLNTDTK
jgi:Tfp pilus assembly protein PilO